MLISEQTAESRFGALLEITDKYSSKLNVFSYTVLQFQLNNILESFITIVYKIEKHSGLIALLETQ